MKGDREQAFDYLMSGFLFGMVFGSGIAAAVGWSFLVGVLSALVAVGGFVFVLKFVEANVPCRHCNGKRVVLYAGDMERDDGYCELQECSMCAGGKRVGRSDVPIVSDNRPDPTLRVVK